jgi:hypothetical protein
MARNFAKSRVSTGYDAAATTIVLSPGGGEKMPAVPFNAVWWNATAYPDPSDDPRREVVTVSAIVGDTLTIARAQEGTSASIKNTLGAIYMLIAGLTAGWMNATEEALGKKVDAISTGASFRVKGGNLQLWNKDALKWQTMFSAGFTQVTSTIGLGPFED